MSKIPSSLSLIAFLASIGLGIVLPASTLRADDPPKPANTPSITPSTMHVTVPGEPGKPAKEGWAQPGGGLKTDEYGNLIQNQGVPSLTPVPAPQGAPPPKPRGTGGPAAAPPTTSSIPVGPAPSGPAVATGMNTAKIRGIVKSFEAGKSITMTVKKTGKDITYTLTPDAKVPAGLKAGDSVRIRVLTAEKGKVADQVEILPKP